MEDEDKPVTVRELIAWLAQLDPDLEVWTEVGDPGYGYPEPLYLRSPEEHVASRGCRSSAYPDGRDVLWL